MNACRWRWAFVALSFFSCCPAFAGAPPIDEFTCIDARRMRVKTSPDPRQRYFATASAVFTGSTGGNAFEIRINPERTYLGKATQQWLYLRQCAHIVLHHDVVNGEQGLKIRDEEEADCWAAQELTKKGGGSTRILYSVESDMDGVLNNTSDRWREVLPGPKRRVLLSSCLRK